MLKQLPAVKRTTQSPDKKTFDSKLTEIKLN